MKEKLRRFISLLLFFMLFTNSIPKEIMTAASADGETRKADLCFVIDTTGSMGGYIKKITRNLTEFVNRLNENNIDLKLSLIEFRDSTTDADALEVHEFPANSGAFWTGDVNAFIERLNSLQAKGGGDTAETPTNALIKVPKGRSDANQFVFLLTDADYKGANSRMPGVTEMQTILSDYRTRNICASVVSRKNYEELYRPLYKMNNGIFMDIDRDDYSDLLLQIADWIQINSMELINGAFYYAGTYSNTHDAKAQFFYSDSYFFESSEYYNEHLATMSICLALSTTSTMGKHVKYTKDEEWPERTTEIQNLFKKIGFDHFKWSDDWNHAPKTNTIGAVAASKELSFRRLNGEDDKATLIAIAVRGTGYYDEWGGNLNVGGSDEHTGFKIARNKVLDFLKDYIVENHIQGRIKLWITGYSRAGATTNLVAGALNSQMDNGVLHGSNSNSKSLPAGVTLAHNELYAYALEPPMGIQNGMNKGNNSNIHNVVNIYDPVPMTAMEGWNFTRYNKDGNDETNRTLPNESSKDYSKAKKARDFQFSVIKAGEPSDADTEKLKEDYSEWGKQIVVVPEIDLIRSAMLRYPVISGVHFKTIQMKGWGMDWVEHRLLNTATDSTRRWEYSLILQNSMVDGIQDLLGLKYDGDFKAYAENVGKILAWFACVAFHTVVDDFFNVFYLPSINPLTSPAQKIVEIEARLISFIHSERWKKMIVEQADDCGVTLAVEKDAARFMNFMTSVAGILAKLLYEDSGATLDGLVSIIDGKAAVAHYPEKTMAWLRSQDSFYSSTSEMYKRYLYPNIQRIIRINCPVNVYVRENGTIVGGITDEKGSSDKDYISCFVNENDEKDIVLPADESYEIIIDPTGDGEMYVSIDEYNMLYSDCPRVINYYRIPIETGKKVIATIPAIHSSEYADKHKASSVAYTLTYEDGTVIKPDKDDKNPSQLDEYTVTVSANNACGLVTGGGKFIEGSFAKVVAYPYSEDGFLGWYKDGKKVSSETTYRFPVQKDTELVAHFKEVPMYRVTMDSNEGGYILKWDGLFPTGYPIALHAEPDEGRSFGYWLVEDGNGTSTLEGADTTYEVGTSDAHITAIFIKQYSFLYGAESTWIRGSNKNLTFIVNSTADNFDHLVIDGVTVDSQHYTVSNNHLCIDLKPSFLSTLQKGKHSIRVCLKDGYADTSFYVTDPLPLTGDNSHIPLWILLSVLIGIAIPAILRRKTRKE